MNKENKGKYEKNHGKAKWQRRKVGGSFSPLDLYGGESSKREKGGENEKRNRIGKRKKNE